MRQVRKIKPTRRSLSGFYCHNGISIPYESTLERDLIIFQTFRSDVTKVVAQPVHIPFQKNGRTYQYTPDYFVQLEGAAKSLIVEVKPREEWVEHWRDWSDKWKSAQQYCKERGYVFKIYDESRIRHRGLESVNSVLRYKRLNCTNSDIDGILELVDLMGTTTIGYILNSLFKEECRIQGKRIIYHLLANQLLSFQPWDELGDETEVCSV